jgi:hypothetical protein
MVEFLFLFSLRRDIFVPKDAHRPATVLQSAECRSSPTRVLDMALPTAVDCNFLKHRADLLIEASLI